MRVELLTESAKQILFGARYWAGELGATEIEPNHLLLGYIACEDKQASSDITARIFAASRPPGSEFGSPVLAGADNQPRPAFLSRDTAERLQNKMKKLGTLSSPLSHEVDMPLSAEPQQVLKSAGEHAGEGCWITALHVLWALADSKDSWVSRCLLAEGVTPEAIDAEIGRREL